MVSISPDQALWETLLTRPTIPVRIDPRTTDLKVYTGPCILDGWILRDTAGGGVIVEFYDGGDVTGYIVGEAIINPIPGAPAVNADTDVDASSANAAAANNVTLPGVAGQTTFITGFEITGAGATGAAELTITVTGILGGTKTYKLAIPAGAGAQVSPLLVEYARPIPAAGLNASIVVNVPSFGAGNTDAAVTAHGFQRQVVNTAFADQSGATSGPGGLNYLLCRNGIFLRAITGTFTGSVWIKA